VTTSPHGEQMSDHLSSEAIADFISGRLSPEGRSTADSHLAECRTCRQQVVSARRLLDSYRPRRRLTWVVPATVAAVALVVFAPRVISRRATTLVLRGDGGANAEASPKLAIVAPADGDTLIDGRVTFVWRGRPGQPLFRLTIVDGAHELWSVSTTDTTVRLPDSVSLAPARSYSWYVDALGADGRSLTSGSQRFQTKR